MYTPHESKYSILISIAFVDEELEESTSYYPPHFVALVVSMSDALLESSGFDPWPSTLEFCIFSPPCLHGFSSNILASSHMPKTWSMFSYKLARA